MTLKSNKRNKGTLYSLVKVSTVKYMHLNHTKADEQSQVAQGLS